MWVPGSIKTFWSQVSFKYLMSRKDYLIEFFQKVENAFGMDISKNQKGVKFALEALRKRMTVDEAVELLEERKGLIRLKQNE